MVKDLLILLFEIDKPEEILIIKDFNLSLMKSPYDYDQTDDLLSRMHVPICSSFVRGNMPT